MNSTEFFMYATFTSGTLALIAAGYIFFIGRYQKSTFISALFIFSGIWALMDGFGVLASTAQIKILTATLAYFGIAFISPTILILALSQSDLLHRVPKGLIFLVWSIGLLYLVTVLTNQFHHLYWSGFDWVNDPIPNSLLFERGPLFGFFVVSNYVFLAASVLVLLYNLTYTRGVLQLQTIGMLLSIFLPWMVHLDWFSRDTSTNHWDYTSIILTVTTTLMLINLNIWGLFDILPIVRDEIPEMIADGIVVVDEQNRVIYMNEAAGKLIGPEYGGMVGEKFNIPLIDQVILITRPDGEQGYIQTKVFTVNRRSKSYKATVIMLNDTTQTVLTDAKIKDLEQESVINEARKRIADDLHDSMAQGLYSLKLLVEEVDRRKAASLPIDDVLRMINQAVNYSITEFRMTLFKLNNNAAHVPLREFIENRLSSVEERVGVQTNLTCSDIPPINDQELDQVTSFISEALNNILTHALATTIDLSVSDDGSDLVITIKDNGIGFDPSVERSGHLGIPNMRDRAKALHGKATFESSDKGTTVTLRFQPTPGG